MIKRKVENLRTRLRLRLLPKKQLKKLFAEMKISNVLQD